MGGYIIVIIGNSIGFRVKVVEAKLLKRGGFIVGDYMGLGFRI